MSFSSNGFGLQLSSLQAFTALMQMQDAWAGRFVFSLGLDEQGAALAVAAHVAGAASLAVERDSARIREVVRNGVADFVVSTLDEALRAIKNELRKRTPITVALHDDPDTVLKAALERGLAPELFSRFDGCGSRELLMRASESFTSCGTELVDFELPAGSSAPDSYFAIKAADLVDELAGGREWLPAVFHAASAVQLRAFDAAALSLVGASDLLRHRWLEGVPRVLQRQRPPHRCLWLTAVEMEQLRQRGLAVEVLLDDALGDTLP